MQYKVEVREILRKEVTIEAETPEDAIHKAKDLYFEEVEIVLEYSDFYGETSFKVLNN